MTKKGQSRKSRKSLKNKPFRKDKTKRSRKGGSSVAELKTALLMEREKATRACIAAHTAGTGTLFETVKAACVNEKQEVIAAQARLQEAERRQLMKEDAEEASWDAVKTEEVEAAPAAAAARAAEEAAASAEEAQRLAEERARRLQERLEQVLSSSRDSVKAYLESNVGSDRSTARPFSNADKQKVLDSMKRSALKAAEPHHVGGKKRKTKKTKKRKYHKKSKKRRLKKIRTKRH